MIPNLTIDHMEHSGNAGDNCDEWGNALPVYAASAAPTVSAVAPNANDALTAPAAARFSSDPGPVETPQGAPTASPSDHHRKILARVESAPEVQKLKAESIAEKEVHAEAYQAALPLTDLEGEIRTTEALLNTSRDIAVLGECRARLSILKSPAGAVAAHSACRALVEKVAPFHAKVLALMEARLKALTALAAEVKEAEAALFNQFEMPWQPTAISRSIESARRSMEQTAKAVRMPEGGPAYAARAPHPSLYDHAIHIV